LHTGNIPATFPAPLHLVISAAIPAFQPPSAEVFQKAAKPPAAFGV
jgi:hypothetical protein